MGLATDRPYGQDGGVVQLPLALDKILAGQSPYGADYSDSILGQQARSSAFWEPFGGNPILRHHAYLPGTHAIFMPFYLASKAALGVFDPRFVTLLAYASRRLARGAPLRERARPAWWPRVSPPSTPSSTGTRSSAPTTSCSWPCSWPPGSPRIATGPRLAGLLLGLACATKQLAWPFAPFLLLHLSGARQWRELLARETWRRLRGPLAVAALVFAAIVGPVAALDPKAFYADIVVYNVGLPGRGQLPAGRHARLWLRELPHLLRPRLEPARVLSRSASSTCSWCPWGSGLVHAQLRDGRPGAGVPERQRGPPGLALLLPRRASELPDPPGRAPAPRPPGPRPRGATARSCR